MSSTSAPNAPASGCGKRPRRAGERTIRIGDRVGVYLVSVPRAYDPSRRYPLGFAFHGRNRNHRDCQRTDCAGFQSIMGDHAVLVYPQSVREPQGNSDGGWERPSELEANLRLFESAWSEVERDFCIDSKRVFLAGTSSGGTFVNLLGCRYADRLLAVAPVSGGWQEPGACPSSPAALLIHGIDDPHVPMARGVLARTSYQQRSGCGAESEPPLDHMHGIVRRARDAKPSVEIEQCVDYLGCQAGRPLRWCEHSYGGYDGSTHGWPPSAGRLIWDFVSRL
jgi:poly(3-hydroxybutyrate) depolymerase